MPYAIRKIENKWVVVKADTGKKVAEHDNKEKAQRQLNLLRAIEYGWKPTKNKKR